MSLMVILDESLVFLVLYCLNCSPVRAVRLVYDVYDFFSDVLFFFILVENRRSIARSHIVALLIYGGRIVNTEKIIQNFPEIGFCSIVRDLDPFGVAGMVIISRILIFAADVAYLSV